MTLNIAKEITFLEFCKVLDDIRSTSKHALKYQKLQQFYTSYRKKSEEMKIEDPSAEVGFFPILRLLVPQLERERPTYGLNKFGLRRILAKILSLTKDSDGFKKLGSEQYDFADTAYNLLRKQFNKTKNLSIFEINEYLDSFAQKHQDNRVAHQDKVLTKLLQETSPEEQKWLIRIILKTMHLGLSETKILDSYHPNATVLLNNTNSLLTVCNTLTNLNVKINDLDIALFAPIRPMLSKRCDARELFKSVTDTKNFIVETKFDGERFQLHMKNDQFKYFSRRGYDFTKKFGETYNTGLYTPLLMGIFNSNVKSVLLDGEMMGWNKSTNEFGSKGMNFDVKNLTDTSVYQPCFCVFDILILNDEILVRKSLEERINILKDVFTPRQGVILQSIRREAYTKQDIIAALNESMDKKEEGIVYKDPNSCYIPNDRNGGWWKMKLEYFSGVMSDLDVLIMGGFYGKQKQIDGFIVGVSVPSQTDPTPRKYLALAKITTGLNADEWKSIHKHLDPHWVTTSADNYESHGLDFGKMKPDVWVPPKKSCILLVRAAELMKISRTNSDFKTPYTLRFPRIESIRFDKPYHDCLSITELEELVNGAQPVQKLYNKHLSLEDIEYEFKKTKKFRPKFQDTNVQVEEKISNILKNHEFYVLSGSSEWKIDEIEKTIKENGGSVVKAEGTKTFCILAGEKHSRMDYYKGSVDIVKLSWLQKVLDRRTIFLYGPEDMLYTSTNTRYRFLKMYDKYGDSYIENATTYTLENVFNNIKEQGDYIFLLPKEIEELLGEIKLQRKCDIFNDYTVYFDKYKVVNDPSSDVIYDSWLDELMVKFWNGTIVDVLTEDVNLIITHSDDTSRKTEILTYLACDRPVEVMPKSFMYNKIDKYIKNS